ncbi:MAG TPA: coenzyme F420-0:L-glutamate ligase [Methanothrix sp.]|nr:coenzyme F420-0:L-glutamate ligase [Methanothrix sp.]
MSVLQVLGIKTDLIRPGDDLAASLEKAMTRSGLAFQDGDILVVSESTVATAERRVVALHDVTPGPLALSMAAKYSKDPREMELILQESDEIIGGIPGVVLTLREGFLYPNAGIDNSNAPPGHVVLFPADAQKSAFEIRERMAKGRKIAVVIGDSRTHPLRLGCVGVALACVGLDPVEDARGQKDLFGRLLKITRKAVADNLVSAAQIVMGEGDESIPAVIIRGAPVPISEKSIVMPTIPPQECMYIGALRCSPRPYTGGYDQLIEQAKEAMKNAYAPYSEFRVGAALLSSSGRIYSAGNIENASSGAGICAERAAIAKAIASGEREFEAIAVVGNVVEPISPCGICRQNLIEFGEDIVVIMGNTRGDALTATVADLLPRAFTGKCLG